MDAYRQFVEAAEKKDADKMSLLFKEHPDLHRHEGDEGSLIDFIRYSFPEFFERAFASGFHPDSGPPNPHQTLLQMAVCDGNIDLVRLCLLHGANVERRNGDGETALGYAAAWASVEIVEILLKGGADVNAIEGTAETGFSTALDAACSTNPEYNRLEIRECLQKHGGKAYAELMPK